MFSDLSLSQIVIVAGCLLASLTLHEAMHAFTAHYLGDTTAQEQGRLTLNPLQHIDLMTTILLPIGLMLLHFPPFFIARPVPFDPRRVRYGEYGAALVALAGPFTNLALAGLSALALRMGAADFGDTVGQILVLFTQVNIMFFVFNMIPFPPLDGSRLLYAVAPEPVKGVMAKIESAGFPIIIFFMLVLFPFISPFISNITGAIYNFLLR